MRRMSVLLIAATLMATASFGQVAVRGEKVYTMAGLPITDGVVLIRNGKIESVGPAARVRIPSGYRTLTAKVVTPGLIDAHSVVGLSGYLNQPHDQDQIEKSAPLQPELRAIDAYNPEEVLVEYLRGFGITTVHTGHAPGALMSGQTMIAKTWGHTVDEAVMVPEAMIAATVGEGALVEGGKAPGTRAKGIAMIRTELIKAQEYARKRATASEDKKPSRDLHLDALASVLDRKTPLLVTAHRANDILAVLRVAGEFKVRVILDGAAEAYLVIDQIKAAGVPVIIHPTMTRSNGQAENASFETASILRKAGIPIALQSSFEAYVPKTRVVLFEAALAAAHGLSMEEALATITIDAARILGVEARVGSLEKGKDGDVALFDGDPFEYTSHVTGVIIEGRVVSEEAH